MATPTQEGSDSETSADLSRCPWTNPQNSKKTAHDNIHGDIAYTTRYCITHLEMPHAPWVYRANTQQLCGSPTSLDWFRGFLKWGSPKNGWFIRENPMNMDDDWGHPDFRKPPVSRKTPGPHSLEAPYSYDDYDHDDPPDEPFRHWIWRQFRLGFSIASHPFWGPNQPAE